MKHTALFFASPLVFAIHGCGGGHPPATTTPAQARLSTTAATNTIAPRQLSADTPMKTASGASFEAPKGWFYSALGESVALENPEHDFTLTLLEIANEPSGAKAIELAWARVKPDFKLKAAQVVTPPATDGWEGVTQVVYDTPGSEHRATIAIARKLGNTNYVALLDGGKAGLDRRGAQLMTVISSFKPAGLAEESLAGRTARSFGEEESRRLDLFLDDATKRAEIPGAALAVVQHGKIVYQKGFGVRMLGKKDPVTPNTLFMIGSTTKSLTTLLMAKLVDEGKFGWETPVSEVLPSFALADADTTKKVLMKHTVCACAGLPRQDMEFIFEYANVTPEQRVASMASMRPTTGFGETFQYSNTMVATGGYVAAHSVEPKAKLGPAYDRAMQTRIFEPLGMISSTFDVSVAKGREHAMPHSKNIRGEESPIPLENEGGVVPVRPAGAAWSNARDMSKFVLLELAKGRDEKGAQVVSEANLLKRREPQIKITDKMAYGLGLFIENDHGITVVHHGGNNLGFTSDMALFPDSDVGMVLLTNSGGANSFRKSVRRRLVEILFDAKEQASTNLDFGLRAQRDAVAKELSKVVTTSTAEWTRTVLGKYTSPSLGVMTLRLEGTKAILDAGEWKSAFGQIKEADGTVSVVLLDAPLAGLEFKPAERNGHKTLNLDAAQQRYEFVQE